jgi:hypothetical protein
MPTCALGHMRNWFACVDAKDGPFDRTNVPICPAVALFPIANVFAAEATLLDHRRMLFCVPICPIGVLFVLNVND